MNSERLASLHLMPPPAASAWATSGIRLARTHVRRPDNTPVPIELPLFWYQPRWIHLPTDLANMLASAVANLDVMVTALRRDLSESDDDVGEFFAAREQAPVNRQPRPPVNRLDKTTTTLRHHRRQNTCRGFCLTAPNGSD